MAEGFIVRKGGVTSETTAAPTITIIEESDKLIFTLTNNDDNTAIITYEIDDILESIELAAAATSSNITIDTLDSGEYTLTAYATVVGEVASSESVSVEIEIFEYTLLGEVNVTTNTTQIDFDNLNITKDDEIRLVYTFKNGASGTSIFSLYANDITTNYVDQTIAGISTSLLAFRAFNEIARTTSVRSNSGFADIKISNNDKFVIQANHVYALGSQSSDLQHRSNNIVNTGTVTSITKLSVVSSINNGIVVGSRLQLYKVVS